MSKRIVFFLLLSLTLRAQAQRKDNDFSAWYWLQMSKDIGKQHYVSLQFQSRFDNNASFFDANNFYFMFGTNALKYVNVEALYQLRSNYKEDNHTLYLGVTRKFSIKNVDIYFRTAYQHTRNYFSGDYIADHPVHEWRNRLRIRYKLNTSFNLAFSAEPTIHFWNRPPYLDKVRYMALAEMRYNKYQSVSLFYIYQPNVYDISGLNADFIGGITYQVFLPKRLKKIKHFFRPKIDTDFHNYYLNSSRDQL